MSKKPPTLADQLRAEIKAQGLSGYALAKGTGISEPTIYRFVNGGRAMSLENADKLLKFLGFTLTPPTPKGKA